MAMSGVQKTVLVTLAAIALVIGAVVNKVSRPVPLDPEQLSRAGIFLFDTPRALPDISMTSATGQAWGKDDLNGQWDLLFFGYTFCPDICPATLAQLRQLQGQLPPETLAKLRIVLVTVDPHRDTPEQLKKYLDYFDAGFIGLTGEEATIQKLANGVSIPFIPADTSKENYTVDHSGNLVLIGPDGKQRGFIRAPINNTKLAAQLPGLLDRP